MIQGKENIHVYEFTVINTDANSGQTHTLVDPLPKIKENEII